MNPDAWDILRRAKKILLSFLCLFSLTWAIFFAIFLSHEWSRFALFQKIVVIALLSIHFSTAILMYLMAVATFCPWRDVVRVIAIFVVHTGSSVLFTRCGPSFPCLSFGTETVCKELVFITSIGCWVFSGINLCFAIVLAVIAFVPRPVPVEPSPDTIKVGGPSHSIRTGPVTYSNRVNSTHGDTITLEPPRLWQSFQSRNSRHSNETRKHGGTTSTRNAPGGRISIGSVPHRTASDSFSQKFFRYSPTSRIPVFSRVGGKNTPDRPNQSSASPKLQYDAFSPIPLRNSPSLATMPRAVYSVLSNNSVLTSPWDGLQKEQTYPDHARTMTPSAYPHHPTATDVYFMAVEPIPYVLLPSVPTPGVNPFGAPKDLSSGNASFAASGSNAPLLPGISQPPRTVQRSGGSTAHHPSMPPIKESPHLRRDINGQASDQTQWWGLVKSAAAQPHQ